MIDGSSYREWKQIVEDESVDEIMERIDPDEMMSFIKMAYRNNS